jgi:hypothetical protein
MDKVSSTASKKFAELVRCDAGIPDNASHRERVHRIVPGNRQNPPSVCHDDVLALSGDAEPRFFECPDSPEMRDSRYLRHVLCRNFHFPQILLAGKLFSDFEIFANGVLDVRQRLLFRCALRPAPWETGARNAEPPFGWHQCNWVLHTCDCSMGRAAGVFPTLFRSRARGSPRPRCYSSWDAADARCQSNRSRFLPHPFLPTHRVNGYSRRWP